MVDKYIKMMLYVATRPPLYYNLHTGIDFIMSVYF